HGLLFGPETSSANRCCIGGMTGNNSCGLHSLKYGSVRDHISEMECMLSDGSKVIFKDQTSEEFNDKCNGEENLLETKIYKNIKETLSNSENQKSIREGFPDPKIKRRNNGYAIDALLETDPFTKNGEKINICKLLAGSEGTLAFSLKIKLDLNPLPPKFMGLVCPHFSSLEDAFKGNIIALKHHPRAIELMDDMILECTKENKEQLNNRFFVQGDPKAILMIEFAEKTEDLLLEDAKNLEEDLKKQGLGYAFPLIQGTKNIKKVWALRTAGLGILSNIPGDRRSTTVIEDTAVNPEVIYEYIKGLDIILKKYNLNCVKYGHIATGELHLRPLLNLKDKKDIKIYHDLASDVAELVKKFKGSLSGEHGDGRLRGEFIPYMLGKHNYQLIKNLKKTWDPDTIFNPGKIIDTPPITNNLRYKTGAHKKIKTYFDFSSQSDYLRAIERCTGSADCRKSVTAGGGMCPSYRATGDEDKSTRARANLLRELLTRAGDLDPFDSKEIMESLDLCLSCKACKSECPSDVDMTKIKAEYLQHYYDIHGAPFRSRLIAYMPRLYKFARIFRPLSNIMMETNLFKKVIGFSTKRNIPELSKETLKHWMNNKGSDNKEKKNGNVYFFADEFTDELESDIGEKAILLLRALGYKVIIPRHRESGRTYLSKGLVRAAKKVAEENVMLLSYLITEKTPLIGIEPSAILSFRDEYPELVSPELKDKATKLKAHTFMFEEFIMSEFKKGKIKKEQFTKDKKTIKFHGHCQQKAVASTESTKAMLSIPENYEVTEIEGGCCGMAGSFGYEKEHYEMSNKIGELTLFPEIRNSKPGVIFSASGTSCRHQIQDGTEKKALHPVEVLYNALK
ncbi:MAG: 4Fe-4S dicluster domain-containing protein, partial [Prolixibacteraceae bacterium]|nr:4Fe-4S dicluster domain-containing protein [Prolixibacteraceae bacterium]